ncbi:IS91 family transposase [bacterium]|nr:IS91 family transposase [bacterium]
MPKPALEVADIFRKYGKSFVQKYGSSMSTEQRRVMRAIEICRTAALGGHVDECDECGHQVISYNSCRNRHCPKCQTLAKAEWLEARRDELLPVEYYHVVFTIPDSLAAIALQNKRIVYNILFQAASKTLLTIAADPQHLGAQIGVTAVLHTWGQNLMHHPHIHCVVPGGGLTPEGEKWISCRTGFFLPVKVLSRLFRRLFLEALIKAFQQGKLFFYGKNRHLIRPETFNQFIESCRKIEWVVYAKPPFGGPETVLDYLARYTHRIAIANHRLLSMKEGKVTFTLKNYRNEGKQEAMTLQAYEFIRRFLLQAYEFIRRFLLHVLPHQFMRIRYYGFLANRHRAENIQLCRSLLNITEEVVSNTPDTQGWAVRLQALTGKDPLLCPHCGCGHLITIQTLPPLKFNQSRSPPGVYPS